MGKGLWSKVLWGKVRWGKGLCGKVRHWGVSYCVRTLSVPPVQELPERHCGP